MRERVQDASLRTATMVRTAQTSGLTPYTPVGNRMGPHFVPLLHRIESHRGCHVAYAFVVRANARRVRALAVADAASFDRLLNWLSMGRPSVLLYNTGGVTQAFAALHTLTVRAPRNKHTRGQAWRSLQVL